MTSSYTNYLFLINLIGGKSKSARGLSWERGTAHSLIKQIDSMLPCVCSVIDYRRRQNVARTVTRSPGASMPLSSLINTFDVICYLLLNRRKATWNIFVK